MQQDFIVLLFILLGHFYWSILLESLTPCKWQLFFFFPIILWKYVICGFVPTGIICMLESHSLVYLGDGVDCVPALVEHFRIWVVEQTHEAGEQRAGVCAVVEACSGEVSIQDGNRSLSQSSVRPPRGGVAFRDERIPKQEIKLLIIPKITK